MAIHALIAASIAPTPVLPAPKARVAADHSNIAAKPRPVANDADGDLQHDLATGENPYAAVGSTINTKA